MPVNQVTRKEGQIIFIAGSSRSGKTLHAIRLAKRHKRLMIWDPDDEWSVHGAKRLTHNDAAEFERRCFADTAGQYAFVAPCTDAWFQFFCSRVFVWLSVHPGGVVADEIADVTHAGKAPEWWGRILRRGKKRGGYIYVIANSPAESDKTALKNANEVHCHALTEPPDIKRMAQRLGVHYDVVASVLPWQSLGKTDLAKPPVLAGDLRPDLVENPRK